MESRVVPWEGTAVEVATGGDRLVDTQPVSNVFTDSDVVSGVGDVESFLRDDGRVDGFLDPFILAVSDGSVLTE